jgi:hypothetical protein
MHQHGLIEQLRSTYRDVIRMDTPDLIRETKLQPMTVRLPARIHAELDAEAKRSGLTKSTVIHLMLSDQIEHMKKPRLEKYLVVGERAILYDRKLDEIVSIAVKNAKLLCSKDIGEHSCDHTRFAENIPEIAELLEE